MSIHVSRFIVEIGSNISGMETQLVDPLDFKLPFDGDNEETKDPAFSRLVARADGFLIIVPEYNHGIPGSLKRMIDSEDELYKFKPVAFAGVSSGFAGGTRAIEQLISVVRAVGMFSLQKDLYFPFVQKIFTEEGEFIGDSKHVERVEKKFLELMEIAQVLKQLRVGNHE